MSYFNKKVSPLENEVLITDISKLCRICSKLASPPISLLDPPFQPIMAGIMKLFNLQIDPWSGYPTVICSKCLKATNDWLVLKQTCVSSQEYFYSVIGETSLRSESTSQISTSNPEQVLIKLETPENSNTSINFTETIDVSNIKFESTEEGLVSAPEGIFLEHSKLCDEILVDKCDIDEYTKVPKSGNCSKNVHTEIHSATAVQALTSHEDLLTETSNTSEEKSTRVSLERTNKLHTLLTKKTFENSFSIVPNNNNMGQFDLGTQITCIEPKVTNPNSKKVVYIKLDEFIKLKIHELDKGRLCEICNKRYRYLHKHFSQVHLHLSTFQINILIENADLAYRTCPLCKKVYTEPRGMKMHLLNHNKPFFNCNKCRMKFRSEVKLHFHKLRMHPLQELLVCSFCEGKFVHKFSLKKHIIKCHIKCKRIKPNLGQFEFVNLK